MSSLQDKMYNHEIVPPTEAWERIAAALDDSETENRFPSKLYNARVNPPVAAWSNITQALEENQPAFPEKLYNLGIDPPAGVWDKIDSSLNPSTETVALVKRLKPFFRYAAAAAFIGAIAYGIIRMTVNSGDKENNAVVMTGGKDSGVSAKEAPANLKKAEIVTTPDKDPVLEKSKKMVAGLDGKKSNRKAATSVFSGNATDDIVINPTLSQSIYAYADHIPDIADRYVMLMTPDGNIIRMSKKWSELLCCVSGEDQDAGCKNQLKKWQEKLASSSLAPSSANFMDILDLVSSLDETNGL